MKANFLLMIVTCGLFCGAVQAATFEQTEYSEDQKVVFDFYFNHPVKMGAALFWLRTYINTLMAEPYNMAPEFMDIKVIIRGAEIVTMAKKNYAQYRELVERVKYYQALGVEFRACLLAARDYGYNPEDLQDFLILTPSALNDVVHWQLEGYAVITPNVQERVISIDEIR